MNNKFKELIKRNVPSILINFARNIRHSAKLRVSKRHINYLIKERKTIYLEIGAGNKKGKNGWITLDLTPDCDIYWDLNKGLPFPDKSIYKIYSSHVFEHFTFKEGQKLLDECLRVLVKDGIFSICVPNAKLWIDAYSDNNKSLNKNQFFGYKLAYNNISQIDYVNYIAYMDGHHKYMFDEKNLIIILEKKGFGNVRLRNFDPSLDLKERNYGSIYAEAQK
jgi:predicted SAM-dependent methyltransferase